MVLFKYYINIYRLITVVLKIVAWKQINLKMKSNASAGSVPSEDFYFPVCSLCFMFQVIAYNTSFM